MVGMDDSYCHCITKCDSHPALGPSPEKSKAWQRMRDSEKLQCEARSPEEEINSQMAILLLPI